MTKVKYGSKVLIRDHSVLDGCEGVVIKVSNENVADVLLDREVLWPVALNELERVS